MLYMIGRKNVPINLNIKFTLNIKLFMHSKKRVMTKYCKYASSYFLMIAIILYNNMV